MSNVMMPPLPTPPMPQPLPPPMATPIPPPPIAPPMPMEPKVITVPVPVPTKEIKKKPSSVITPKDIAKAQASYKRPDPKQQATPPMPPLKPGWGGGG